MEQMETTCSLYISLPFVHHELSVHFPMNMLLCVKCLDTDPVTYIVNGHTMLFQLRGNTTVASIPSHTSLPSGSSRAKSTASRAAESVSRLPELDSAPGP